MRRKIVSIAVAAGIVVAMLGLTACSAGPVETKSFEVQRFDRVVVSGFGTLVIDQGNTESLEVEAGRNLLNRVEVTVEEGVLHIEMKNRFPWFLPPAGDITYYLVVEDLEKVQLDGAGDIEIDKIDVPSLEVVINGAGSMEGKDLRVAELIMELNGAGSMVVGGEAIAQEATLSGAGSLDAGDLRTEETALSLSGAGSATVWAEQRLDIEMSGAGSVTYYGDPRVTQDVSGAGDVRSAGDK